MFCFLRSFQNEVDVDRVWATALAMCVAESLDQSWMVDGEQEKTIVDLSRSWLEEQAC